MCIYKDASTQRQREREKERKKERKKEREEWETERAREGHKEKEKEYREGLSSIHLQDPISLASGVWTLYYPFISLIRYSLSLSCLIFLSLSLSLSLYIYIYICASGRERDVKRTDREYCALLMFLVWWYWWRWWWQPLFLYQVGMENIISLSFCLSLSRSLVLSISRFQ